MFQSVFGHLPQRKITPRLGLGFGLGLGLALGLGLVLGLGTAIFLGDNWGHFSPPAKCFYKSVPSNIFYIKSSSQTTLCKRC